MLSPSRYLKLLSETGVSFFAGVPDSLLKDFCACITSKMPSKQHIITANEGGAIGLAIGHHLGTGGLPLVYLQNSGLGNVVNPILSLASPEVYSIPMLLMIGWRGEPGVKDEPQHIHQGRIMTKLLEDMDIPVLTLSDQEEVANGQTLDAIRLAKEKSCPVALVVRKGTFESYQLDVDQVSLDLSREQAILEVAHLLDENSAVVSTTGMISRELFEFRANSKLGHHRDFLTVGGMGHASQIALGLAIAQPKRQVYCFDGDGASLMHLGSMAIVGQSNAENLIHIVFNNGVHDSVGGQPTVGFQISLSNIARACGYSSVHVVKKLPEIKDLFTGEALKRGPHFIEIYVRPGSRKDIGRPTTTPLENKEAMMSFLGTTL